MCLSGATPHLKVPLTRNENGVKIDLIGDNKVTRAMSRKRHGVDLGVRTPKGTRNENGVKIDLIGDNKVIRAMSRKRHGVDLGVRTPEGTILTADNIEFDVRFGSTDDEL
jgi:hypothetical protein